MIHTPPRLAGLSLSCCLVLTGVLAAGPARAGDRNEIRGVEVAEGGGAIELAIQGSRPPSYTVFKLQDPPRLVVDLTGADVSKVAPVEVGRGGVVKVTTAQYQDAKNAVGRVIVALDGPRNYEVAPRGDAVVIRILEDSPAPAPPPEHSVAAGDAKSREPGDESTASAQVAQLPVPPPPPAVEPAPAVAAAPAAAPPERGAAPSPTRDRAESRDVDPNVVSRSSVTGKVKRPARVLAMVKGYPGRLLLALDGEIARVDVIELANPPRLALDLHGVARGPSGTMTFQGSPFEKVRFGKDAGKVRVVLDAAGDMPRYTVSRVGRAVAIDTPLLASAQPERRDAMPKTVTLPTAPAKATPAASLADLRFKQTGAGARVEIDGKVRFTVSRPDDRTVVLSLDGASLPKKLERTLDTSALSGPVLLLSAFNQPSTGQVKVVATLRGPAEDRIVETRNGIAWTFAPRGEPTPVVTAPVEAKTSAPAAAGFGTEAPGYALSGAPQARGYTGRRITLDFHDIEIRNLLRLIADVSKKNIVVADDVSGKVTVTLRNVPWDQALDLVLKSKGLGKEELGNVIRVAKFEKLAEEAKARAQAEKDRQPTLPLKVRIIPVNFARAQDVAGRVKDVLSERGSVSTDERTNVLIVKDIQEALVRAEGLVRNLDTEIPQVLIESRIVEASSNFTRALGVQWGGNAAFTQATGNPTGAVFPNNVGVSGGSTNTGNSTGTASPPNYAVSLPAAVGDGSGGALGFIFGSAGGAFNLNLRLSALENSGEAKTVSAPKIATVDNREATIGQGISIPFSQTSASGVNTVFVEAKLELKVTPHVSADGSILLKIKATNNQPNAQLTGANGQPSITKREAETEVLVKDGETTVIGGIYTRQTSNSVRKVPFFGSLPLLGYFFRSNLEADDHTELLIFITPRILNRQGAGAAGN